MPEFRSYTADSQASREDGVINVSLKSLIHLRQQAGAFKLKPGTIRSQHSGQYLSSFKGRGMTFEEARPYIPGDDIRSLDWRVMARTGKAHTKLFREERERHVLLCVDLSYTMFFATRGAFKAVRAAQTAALLSWSALQHKDRLGGMIFNQQQHHAFRPKSGKAPVLHFLQQLAQHCHPTAESTATADIDWSSTLQRLQQVSTTGNLLVLISDFATLQAEQHLALGRLARHNELLLIHIHDPLEAELPARGQYRFSDGLHFVNLNTQVTALRQRYRQHYQQRLAQLQQLARQPNIRLLSLSTQQIPEQVLRQQLGAAR